MTGERECGGYAKPMWEGRWWRTGELTLWGVAFGCLYLAMGVV